MTRVSISKRIPREETVVSLYVGAYVHPCRISLELDTMLLHQLQCAQRLASSMRLAVNASRGVRQYSEAVTEGRSLSCRPDNLAYSLQTSEHACYQRLKQQ